APAWVASKSDLEIPRIGPGGFGAAVAVAEVGGFDADLVLGGDAGGDEDVAADDGAFADDGFPAEDGGTGVDGDVVFDGGMPLLAAEHLAVVGRESTQGDA